MGEHNANTLINLGWGGVCFSFLSIVFGALAFSKPRIGGWGLVVVSLCGAVLGGTFVAACLTLALLGGILAIVSAASRAHATPQPKNGRRAAWWVGGIVVVMVTLSVLIGVSSKNNNNSSSSGDKAQRQSDSNPVAQLEAEPASDLQATGKLAEIFQFGGNATDVQRENAEAAIKGKVIDWQLRVFEVKRKGDNYQVITETSLAKLFTGPATAATRITLTPRDADERTTIEALKTGDQLRIKGRIKGVTLRSLNIEPAVLWTPPPSAKPVPPSAPVAKTDNEFRLDALQERYLTQCVGSTMQNAINFGGMEKLEAAKFAVESCKESSPTFRKCASAASSTFASCYEISNLSAE